LGESYDDRISLIHTLASQEKVPESVPINVLVLIEGTPIGDKTSARVEWDQVVRMIATTRIVMPNTMVRLSAGRKEYSSSEQAFMFFSGANSIFSGDKLLTVNNSSIDEDDKMLQMLGLLTSKIKIKYGLQ
jgi:biotin synthase